MKPTIYFYITKLNRWYTLYLIHPDTGGYAAQEAESYPDLIKQLLTYPIERNANFEHIDKKQFKRLMAKIKDKPNATIYNV